MTIRWTPRSRAGWRWTNGGDVPLGEEREAYRVDLFANGATVRSFEVGRADIYLDADALAEAGAEWAVEVRQIGTHAVGHPARTGSGDRY